MVGDNLLCRFSESDVFVQDDDELVRGSCILSGKFRGWWVRDGRRFSKELGRPAELWSLVECRVMCGSWYGSEPSDFLLMVKGDSFVPVKFEKSEVPGWFAIVAPGGGPVLNRPDGDFLNGVVVMHRLDAKKVPRYLSCVNWAGFGPSDKALVEKVIERGVAALAG